MWSGNSISYNDSLCLFNAINVLQTSANRCILYTQDCLVYNIVLVGLLYSAISHTWNCTVLQEKVNPLK